MAARDRQHIIVRGSATPERYKKHPRKIEVKGPPSPADRRAHGRALIAALEAAVEDARERREEAGVVIEGAEPGVYLDFESPPGFDLQLETLDPQSKEKPIELVSVSESAGVQRATVFVAEGKVGHFLKRFEEYVTQRTAKKGEPKHKPFVERIASLKLATFQSLWTDAKTDFPKAEEAIWWELWLRRHDGHELERFHEFAEATNLEVGRRHLAFPDRIVVLARGTAEQLSSSIDVLNDLAETRRAREAASVVMRMETEEQADWVRDVQARTRPARAGSPAVCVLDTGVNRGHPLLTRSLAATDVHACDPTWNSQDHDGHGTEMAGLALYGDLLPVLASSSPVRLLHVLESVKILPPPGKPKNKPELYGAITADAVSRVEIAVPDRRRTFSMAITAPDQRDRGRPSSWSAALDAIAAGRSFDQQRSGDLVYLNDDKDPPRRLFVVSAGNVEQWDADHLARSDVEEVHDPAQAWNALTVGASTELEEVGDDYDGWTPVARPGDLSPFSSTSVPFERGWPIKPDVVFEGGNLAQSPEGMLSQTDGLSVLTTHFKPQERLFITSSGTSPAQAQVAHISGCVAATYPELWPETIRALVVDSARWTPRMRRALDNARRVKEAARAKEAVIRRYGFGVPDLGRALRSAKNSLTLIAQGTIKPFDEGTFREMAVHDLPWPAETLLEEGALEVRLRVTLSYFIEPNPARRGWRRRYSYESHGLRFHVNRPAEPLADFRKRLNKLALEEGEKKPEAVEDRGWVLGTAVRSKGSLHSDVWEGTAAELSERSYIGIVPVAGWWKEQKKRDRSEFGARYALVVSIETDEEEVDVWTPVANQVGIPIE
jgi:hypothetical protein